MRSYRQAGGLPGQVSLTENSSEGICLSVGHVEYKTHMQGRRINVKNAMKWNMSIRLFRISKNISEQLQVHWLILLQCRKENLNLTNPRLRIVKNQFVKAVIRPGFLHSRINWVDWTGFIEVFDVTIISALVLKEGIVLFKNKRNHQYRGEPKQSPIKSMGQQCERAAVVVN